jgi:hypothetical protein
MGITLEQAREILDTISRQTRMTRDEHSLAGQAIELLYSEAKENQEHRQEVKNKLLPETIVQ